MDSKRLMEIIRNRPTLELAFNYALYDRTNYDYYYDPFEIDYCISERKKILTEVEQELLNIDAYNQNPAYSYFPPKNDLCYRRMIYISFKDLVIRYAVIYVLTSILDKDLSKNCFANRRSIKKDSKSLLDDFSTISWPNFCSWQKENLEKNKILLRTDISSYYDSISHEYLTALLVELLSINKESDFIKLFKKLLLIPVISYSYSENRVYPTSILRQGLPIGSNCEGFLANIYIKNVDQKLSELNIKFGRYNDDMRIFGNERKEVLDAVMVLQELLLSKGLNLNSSKTKIAENQLEQETLRSKVFEISGYFIDEEYEDIGGSTNKLEQEIDRQFDENVRKFDDDCKLENNDDAKDYCKFLNARSNGKYYLPLEKRLPVHVDKLREICLRWQGNTKFVSWLIIQGAFFQNIPEETRVYAKNIIIELLFDDQVNSFAKYKLLHHLSKERRNSKWGTFKYLDQLSSKEIELLKRKLPELLKVPSFELNISSIYVLYKIYNSREIIIDIISKYTLKPVPEPINNILIYLKGEIAPNNIEFIREEEPDAKTSY